MRVGGFPYVPRDDSSAAVDSYSTVESGVRTPSPTLPRTWSSVAIATDTPRALGRIRTDTYLILSQVPLPLGYGGIH